MNITGEVSRHSFGLGVVVMFNMRLMWIDLGPLTIEVSW